MTSFKHVREVDESGRYNFQRVIIICDCGEKYNIVDITRSKLPPMGRDRRELKKNSKRMGVHFAESSDGFFTCLECDEKFDLSNDDLTE